MKTQLATLAVLTAFLVGTATASDVTGITTFTSGTPALAAEVNDNFSAIKTAVDDNQAQIGAVKITADTNTADIATNTGNITTNAGSIATNTDSIVTNTGNITTNADSIVTNAANIGFNLADIADLSTRVIAVPGVATGDMQYWDGSAWVLINAPTAATATLRFCDGKPSWDCIAVGDTGPAGGIVFYVAADGITGLEAAPVDLNAGIYEWGCEGLFIGTTGTSIGSGATNTTDIVTATCSPTTPGNLIAANAADAYSFGTFDDWFLPSKDELAELYLQRDVVGLGSFASGFYWSSSEFSATDAWDLDFSTGLLETGNGKSNQNIGVRAIRAF